MADVNETLLQQETLGGNHGYVMMLKLLEIVHTERPVHAFTSDKQN